MCFSIHIEYLLCHWPNESESGTKWAYNKYFDLYTHTHRAHDIGNGTVENDLFFIRFILLIVNCVCTHSIGFCLAQASAEPVIYSSVISFDIKIESFPIDVRPNDAATMTINYNNNNLAEVNDSTTVHTDITYIMKSSSIKRA